MKDLVNEHGQVQAILQRGAPGRRAGHMIQQPFRQGRHGLILKIMVIDSCIEIEIDNLHGLEFPMT